MSTYSDAVRIAIRSAQRRLREEHPDDFQRLFNEEKVKELRYFGLWPNPEGGAGESEVSE